MVLEVHGEGVDSGVSERQPKAHDAVALEGRDNIVDGTAGEFPSSPDLLRGGFGGSPACDLGLVGVRGDPRDVPIGEGYPLVYVSLIAPHATRVEPAVTALTYRTIIDEDADSPFAYPDTFSTRGRIAAVSAKLKVRRVAIIGLGGTGAYILDLVAKTPVGEIHVFDGDRFHLHNAFRSPGAATEGVLIVAPYKVDYYAGIYSAMHTGILPHAIYMTVDTTSELSGFDFVFIAIDDGDARKIIVAALEEAGVAFIDVGMGLHSVDDTIGGQVRTTLSTPGRRDHLYQRVPLAGAEVDNAYDANIQIADLNALNATMAVIRWKKECGFYADFDHEHHSTYIVDGNTIVNDEDEE